MRLVQQQMYWLGKQVTQRDSIKNTRSQILVWNWVWVQTVVVWNRARFFLFRQGVVKLWNWVSAPVRESKTVLDSGFQELNSSLCQWNLGYGFRTPWAVFRILKSRILDFTSNNIPESGFLYTRQWVWLSSEHYSMKFEGQFGWHWHCEVLPNFTRTKYKFRIMS